MWGAPLFTFFNYHDPPSLQSIAFFTNNPIERNGYINNRMQPSQRAKTATRPARQLRHSISLHAFNSALNPAAPLPLRNSAFRSLHKINCSLHLQNAVAKFAWWAARCYAGLVTKSPLKIRLRCKACHASSPAAASAKAIAVRKLRCPVRRILR